MNEENERYLSVAEFSALAEVSKQAVYKRIDKDLKPYIKTENNIKYISSSALELFNKSARTFTDEVVSNKESINYLKIQLEEKERIIKNQEETITKQNTKIERLQDTLLEQSNKILSVVEKQNELQQNYQILLAQNQKLLLDGSIQQVEKVKQPVKQPVEYTVKEEKNEPKSWWYNLWH